MTYPPYVENYDGHLGRMGPKPVGITDDLIEAKAKELHREYCVEGCLRPVGSWRGWARAILEQIAQEAKE